MVDIKALDLNLLKALDALLDERSVTRAASRLALTQPAVSGMLTRLRESFDDPLFVRTQRGIIPTMRAMELAGPIKQILTDVDELLRPAAFEPATAQFTLSIVATDYAQRAIMVPLLAALRAQAPNIRVAVRPIDDERIQGQLERGDVDLALMTPESAPDELHARHLYEERYLCVMRDDHPIALSGQLSLDQFCAHDHVLASYSGGAFRGVTDDALARLGRSRRVVLSVTSFLMLLEILHSSDLIAVVPQKLLNGTTGLAVFEPPIAVPGFSKLAVWHARTHRDPGHQWVRNLLVTTCQSLGCHLHPHPPADQAHR